MTLLAYKKGGFDTGGDTLTSSSSSENKEMLRDAVPAVGAAWC
jgi:hypothetical protein